MNNNHLRTLVPTAIFIASQIVSGVLAALMPLLIDDTDSSATSSAMSGTLVVGDVIALALLMLTKHINFKTAFRPSSAVSASTAYAIVGAATGIFATNIFSDLITLPDAMEATFMQLKDSILGIASIAIIGPVTEEFIFRQATLGGMLRNGIRPIYAVLLSALLFGIIHFNWAQILPAFFIGIMLGIIYLKTGNIILCTIIHIINNSIAVAQMIVLGENTKDFKLTDALGGYTLAIPLMVACFALSAFLLVKLWRRE